MRCRHEMRFGATLHLGSGATCTLWAPAARRAELVLERPDGAAVVPAERRQGGWYRAHAAGVRAGDRYRWLIDGEVLVPDPASRCNPQGPHGASVFVDPLDFDWDEGWRGRPWHEAVFYELHVGTFTREGTFAAAEARLPELAALGVTALQLMPLADFPGDFGWGYDGVLPFAPYHGYGTPATLKRFVQAAHRLGLMCLADVVYNHHGPDGNYLPRYAPQFYTPHHRTAWGPGINFDDGEPAATVREFIVANALYWMHEYRFDGLRLDAVHAMRDDRRPDILEELSARARAACAGRHVHLVIENDANDARRLGRPGTPGRYDGQWNGDLHHALHVLLTGERDGYYAEYEAPVGQLARCLVHGFAREGDPHGAARRAATSTVPLSACVNFLQNHDQIGNRAYGERLPALADAAALRLAAAIVLLAPAPPLLFMGEENGSAAPFLYFADWDGELRDAVRRGRREEFSQFARYAAAAASGTLPDPCSRATFERCKLEGPGNVSPHAAWWRGHYRELLAVRARELHPVLPRLAAAGHAARHEGTLLEVRWKFEAGAGTPARALLLQANLGAAAAALPWPDPPPGSVAICSVGRVAAGRLGPWSGRWHWVEDET